MVFNAVRQAQVNLARLEEQRRREGRRNQKGPTVRKLSKKSHVKLAVATKRDGDCKWGWACRHGRHCWGKHNAEQLQWFKEREEAEAGMACVYCELGVCKFGEKCRGQSALHPASPVLCVRACAGEQGRMDERPTVCGGAEVLAKQRKRRPHRHRRCRAGPRRRRRAKAKPHSRVLPMVADPTQSGSCLEDIAGTVRAEFTAAGKRVTASVQDALTELRVEGRELEVANSQQPATQVEEKAGDLASKLGSGVWWWKAMEASEVWERSGGDGQWRMRDWNGPEEGTDLEEALVEFGLHPSLVDDVVVEVQGLMVDSYESQEQLARQQAHGSSATPGDNLNTVTANTQAPNDTQAAVNTTQETINNTQASFDFNIPCNFNFDFSKPN